MLNASLKQAEEENKEGGVVEDRKGDLNISNYNTFNVITQYEGD